MGTYKIADLYLEYESSGRTYRLSQKYAVDEASICNDDAVHKLSVTQEVIDSYKAAFPDAQITDWQYFIFGTELSALLMENNGLVLHASAIQYENKAYLFSADSGMGKSTHTQLWLKNFSGASIINDDKPAIRNIDGSFFAYGTPWSGKSDINENVKIPLKAICFIEQGTQNSIERLTDVPKILKLLLSQTLRRGGKKRTSLLYETLDALLRTVPFYLLKCLPDDDAAILAHSVMSM